MKKALLVLLDNDQNESESTSLLKTLDYEVTQTLCFVVKKINPKFYLGKGQTETIKQTLLTLEPDLVCFDFPLSPLIARNLETELDYPIMDREGVILEIFSSRAHTKEARLQVDLARSIYYLPRQRGRITQLSQQRGGVRGSKGEGERLLELDKRRLNEDILKIKKQLINVRQIRETQQKAKKENELFYFALVGYTNVGKSSLLNKLTNSEVLVEDKLFATLDPTTRLVSFSANEKALLSDTVGFVSNLPHLLVEAFKSTLEEAANADALIIMLDATHPDIELCYNTTIEVLKELNALNKPIILLLNKVDNQDNEIKLQAIKNTHPDIIPISVKTGFNLDLLKEQMLALVRGRSEFLTLHLPLNKENLIGQISKDGVISLIEYQEDYIEIKASIKRIYYEKYRQYIK